MKILKKQNGITLVILIITIVVMLILAGTSIAFIINDDGIVDKANEAKSAVNRAEIIDNVKNEFNKRISESLHGFSKEGEEKLIADVIHDLYTDADFSNTEVVINGEKFTVADFEIEEIENFNTNEID